MTIVVEPSEHVEHIDVQERLDGAIWIRLSPEKYDELKQECRPNESLEDKAAEMAMEYARNNGFTEVFS